MAVDPSKTIPTGASEAQDWMQWHKDLKKVFGKKQANSIWTYAWSKRGGINSSANTRTLSNYMEKQGVDFQRTGLAEFGEGIADFGSGFASVGKWFMIVGFSIVGFILVRIIIALTKNPNKTVGQAMMFTPQGRAIKGAKGIKK